MPELPEVETTKLGLAPLLVGKKISAVKIRQDQLRWPIASDLASQITGNRVQAVTRRGKYLLIGIGGGTLIVHLGMSGSLRLLRQATPPSKHDHVDINFASGDQLRFNDPRRFGSLHFTTAPQEHWLLRHLGPEPLGDTFTADYLWQQSQQRRVAIKPHLMNGRIVVGVGNIYASEALFRAGIHPMRAAGRIAERRFPALVASIREVLAEAIEAGGTTLKDFVGGDGRPGYFQQELFVYGREGLPCLQCKSPIKNRVLGQRASYYCSGCQR
jgi:formamidopyrimidine-DNA glycosylase